MNRTVSVTLDVSKTEVPDEVTAVIQQGENASLTISAAVVNEGEVFDLTGKSAQFACVKPDGAVVLDDAEVTDAANGMVAYDVAASVAAAVGKITVAYFILSDDTGWAATTECMAIKVTQGIGSGDIESSDDYRTITKMLAEIKTTYDTYKSVEDEVRNAADVVAKIEEAENTANDAALAANTAASNADKAAESAGTAATKAGESAAKADEAASGADKAREAAQGIVDDEAEHRAAAKESAQAAAAGAAAAKASETASSSAASTASALAGQAAVSESNAAESANSAFASKEKAEASKTAAEKAADDAEKAANRAAAIADINVTDSVTEGSSDVVTAAAVYTFVAEASESIRAGAVSIVGELPATGELGVIYMVPSDDPADGNLYSEHVYKDGTWEEMGTKQMPDLSPYAKTAEVTSAIRDALKAYTDTKELDKLLAAKQDSLTFDAVPTEGSANPVTSDAVFAALAAQRLSVTVSDDGYMVVGERGQ